MIKVYFQRTLKLTGVSVCCRKSKISSQLAIHSFSVIRNYLSVEPNNVILAI